MGACVSPLISHVGDITPTRLYILRSAYVFSWPSLILVSVENRVPVVYMSPGRS